MSFEAVGAFITEYAGYFEAASAVVGAGAAVASGDAQRKAMHTNADVLKQKADMASQQAATNEDAQRRRGALAIGRETSSAAEGSGLGGTNADVIGQSATDAEVDALNIRYGGQVSNLSDTDQANFDDLSASSANSAGYLNAGAAALSSVGNYTNASRKVNKVGYG